LKTVGIICEYNPLHTGHAKQFHIIRERMGEDCAIVCLMSGNFVQRGAPALIDKSLRAKAAILSGADLVLELPFPYALSSAEGFAAGGVHILDAFCDYLCFGCETGNTDSLMTAARMLLSEAFPPLLRDELAAGKSFPAARQAALEKMGADGTILTLPNDILAVEYCKAILSQNSPMQPLPIHRGGNYHSLSPEEDNPSATALRRLMLSGKDWECYVPAEAVPVFAGAALHSLQAGERAMLAKLRTMTDEEFRAVPYGSEGLWRKFMHSCRSQSSLEEILTATKSKRYTRTRLDRMAMCAYLGITEEMLGMHPPYTRVLAMTDTGRQVLKKAKRNATFLNPGEVHDSDYCHMERKLGDLYGLFAEDAPEAPGAEAERRIFYYRENTDASHA